MMMLYYINILHMNMNMLISVYIALTCLYKSRQAGTQTPSPELCAQEVSKVEVVVLMGQSC